MNDRHMVGAFGEKASLGQANGSDVDLIVRGTEFYATYETPDGFPVIYDDSLGLFCYARIEKGRFETTGVAVTSSPPPNLERHMVESDEIRMKKISDRRLQMEQRSEAKTK
jgi:hypothetical protein